MPNAAATHDRHQGSRYRPLGALLLAAALLTTACGGGATASTTPQASQPPASASASAVASASAAAAEPVTLTIVSFIPDQYYRPLFDAFEKAYPNITINLEAVPLETSIASMKDRFSKGDTTYDVFLADGSWTTDMASAGILLDLTDTDYGKEAKDKIPASVLQNSTYNGRLVAAPYWTFYNILMYNKTLLTNAGIDLPSSDPTKPWTYDQLFDAAKKAQQAGAKWGYAEEQPDFYYARQPLIESAGGGSGLLPPDYLTPDVTNAGWVKAMNWYSNIYGQGIAPRGVAIGETWSLFNNGDAAFFIGQPPNADTTTSKIDYGIAPMPYFDGGKAYTTTGAGAWGINPNSPHQDAAFKFITFDTLTLEGAMAGSEVAGLPAMSEGTTARIAKSIEDDPRLKGLDTLAAYLIQNQTIQRPPSAKYAAFEGVMSPAFLDIRNGEDVVKTLEAAQKKLETVMSR